MNKIINAIMGSNNFIITSHYSPDGDNLGSSIGLYYALKSMDKEAVFVLDDNLPANLDFLYKDIKIYKSEEIKTEDYILISLDCGDKDRLCCSNTIKNNAKITINIDHHSSNDLYADLNYVDAKASSTCEVVYDMLMKIDKNIIDKKIANCLYTGLITDTGNFMYSNTNPSSFEMACNLLKLGIDKQDIIQSIYQNNPVNYVKILGESLNTLNVIQEKIATIELTTQMFKNNNITFNDVDGFVNYARDISGVEVGILFKQKRSNQIKVSLRSKSYVNVSEIAKVFGGGGHVRASGCTVNDSLENAKKRVVEEVIKHI
ncbi:DHH family phosphoesterase [Tepidibacter aestuarii]|uniref:DHH family phosphoesterase n=1 Tax=Tepidibacter aestuarii TaxID=2925782 RepID=UPI0020BDE9F0|nr:bifunctional oligoribonuclease/PAP phosphatase NrnA [Tepidibacter aestuarii]CAH2213976.1 bifunctional oligoribonuclease and PAP phosphatase NrnA [Tepidibacter aestuarii]